MPVSVTLTNVTELKSPLCFAIDFAPRESSRGPMKNRSFQFVGLALSLLLSALPISAFYANCDSQVASLAGTGEDSEFHLHGIRDVFNDTVRAAQGIWVAQKKIPGFPRTIVIGVVGEKATIHYTYKNHAPISLLDPQEPRRIYGPMGVKQVIDAADFSGVPNLNDRSFSYISKKGFGLFGSVAHASFNLLGENRMEFRSQVLLGFFRRLQNQSKFEKAFGHKRSTVTTDYDYQRVIQFEKIEQQ